LKVRQTPGWVVFCQALDPFLKGVKGFRRDAQFSDGNHSARLGGLRRRNERDTQARDQQRTYRKSNFHGAKPLNSPTSTTNLTQYSSRSNNFVTIPVRHTVL
jgi:hypothetical protein